jgi:zinc transporter 5/7
MFFDCTGLLAGLAASVIIQWKANEHYTYGYERAEVLGGKHYLLLIFISNTLY